MPDEFLADPTRGLVERIQSDLNTIASCLSSGQTTMEEDPEIIAARNAALKSARDDVKLLLGRPERPEPRRGPRRSRKSDD